MKRINTVIVVWLVVFAVCAAATPAQQSRRPVIQMAILLDTSGSMDGLLDQARSQLWKIVNEFIEAKKNGTRPDLEVALYEYGNVRTQALSDKFFR
jgi:hypothetical protein